MKVVVDTNVVVYSLMDTRPFAAEADQFWQSVTTPIAPDLWEAELANAIGVAVRHGLLSVAEGETALDLALALGIQSVPSYRLWHGALYRAASSGVAVYDSLFVELASREKVPLATFDSKVLRSFPSIARRPGSLVS